MQLESWDAGLSFEEAQRARKLLAPKYPILELFKRYSRSVEPTGGGTWSHKCVCINQEHKQGNERTASCRFNDETQEFYCFGCGWSGDVFDVMAKMANKDTIVLLEDLIGQEGLNLDEALPAAIPKLDLARINQKMSVMLRDYLEFFRGTDCYNEEAVWTEGEFRKIDERLAWLEPTDVGKIKALWEGVVMDIERRKGGRLEECL